MDSYTSFDGFRYLASGPLARVGLAVKRALASGAQGPILIFDDATGRSVDIDTRGSEAEVLARLDPAPSPRSHPEEPRARGRPKLGVVPREVTLLPRHWQWLSTQPGGASVALRKLVEAALREGPGRDARRRAQERAFHFMSGIAGDLPGFEEATRALFADDPMRFAEHIRSWPTDVRHHASKLAFASRGQPDGP
ncbi:MAG TPA: DUF2239 family protein [Steroidobacteraceae bacterium]|nr:DUF2239 family protein [Steroidobacteraceae bacterium]